MQIFFLKIIEMQINIRDFIKTGVWNLEIWSLFVAFNLGFLGYVKSNDILQPPTQPHTRGSNRYHPQNPNICWGNIHVWQLTTSWRTIDSAYRPESLQFDKSQPYFIICLLKN